MAAGLLATNPFKSADPFQVDGSRAEQEKGPERRDPFCGGYPLVDKGEKPRAAADPFLASLAKPAPDPFAGALGEKDEWTRERGKLAQWEGGGEVPKGPQLQHLSGFLGKDTKDPFGVAAPGSAAAAAKAAERAAPAPEPEQPRAPTGREPAFADIDSSEFVCDTCRNRTPRSSFSEEQLAQLWDPIRKEGAPTPKTVGRSGTGNRGGPYRGMVVRVHDKGFGFVECLQLTDKVTGDDVFIAQRMLERVLGGAMAVQQTIQLKLEALEAGGFSNFRQSRACIARVQFWVSKSPDMKLCAEEPMYRFYLRCKKCEMQAKMQKKPTTVEDIILAAQPKPAQKMSGPIDAQASINNLLSKMRSDIGRPQPGAKNSKPAIRLVNAEHYAKTDRGKTRTMGGKTVY